MIFNEKTQAVAELKSGDGSTRLQLVPSPELMAAKLERRLASMAQDHPKRADYAAQLNALLSNRD